MTVFAKMQYKISLVSNQKRSENKQYFEESMKSKLCHRINTIVLIFKRSFDFKYVLIILIIIIHHYRVSAALNMHRYKHYNTYRICRHGWSINGFLVRFSAFAATCCTCCLPSQVVQVGVMTTNIPFHNNNNTISDGNIKYHDQNHSSISDVNIHAHYFINTADICKSHNKHQNSKETISASICGLSTT